MNNLLDLLRILYCIRFFAKDIHYTAKGESFWSDHIFADEIFDGIDDLIDQINENLYLGFNEEAPTSKEVLISVLDEIPQPTSDVKEDWRILYSLIEKGLTIIDSIEDEHDLPQLNALLDTIANELQKKKGLIWRRIA